MQEKSDPLMLECLSSFEPFLRTRVKELANQVLRRDRDPTPVILWEFKTHSEYFLEDFLRPFTSERRVPT